MATGNDLIMLPNGRVIARRDFQDILKAAMQLPNFVGDLERTYDEYLKDMAFFAGYPRDGLPLTYGRSVQTQGRKRWYLEHGFPTHSINKICNRHPLDVLQMSPGDIDNIHGVGAVTKQAILDFQERFRDQIPERAKRRTGS